MTDKEIEKGRYDWEDDEVEFVEDDEEDDKKKKAAEVAMWTEKLRRSGVIR